MRQLHPIAEPEPVSTDFPPTWHEFEAARRRFFAGLAAPAAAAGDGDSAEADAPRVASVP